MRMPEKRRSPYWPVLTHPVLRRVLPGIGLASLGGGMTTLAVSWLAMELAPPDAKAMWVSVAVAATVLPGAVGGVLLGRWMTGRPGAVIAGWDAWLRAACFALIPMAYLAGILTIHVFVALLAVASLLAAWGRAGRYAMLSELLPPEDQLAGNSLLNVVLEASTIFGPLITAAVIARANPATAIGIIAATSAVLALNYRLAVPAAPLAGTPGAGTPKADVSGQLTQDARTSSTGTYSPGPSNADSSKTMGFTAIARQPTVLALIGLSFAFFFSYGPITVALPLYVNDVLGAPAATLAGFYTAFGIGAVAGALAAGHVGKWPLATVTAVTTAGFGVGLIPLAAGAPVAVSWVAYAVSGLMWGPFPTLTTTLFQRFAAPEDLTHILAARSAVMGLAIPLGALAAGPAVAAWGPRPVVGAVVLAMAVSGLLTLQLGKGLTSGADDSGADDAATVAQEST